MDRVGFFADELRELGARRPGKRMHYAADALLPRDPDQPPLAPRHVPGSHELVLVGWGQVRVETPGKGFDLSKGDLLLIGPGVVHQAMLTARDPQYGLFWCIMDNASVLLGWATSSPTGRVPRELKLRLWGRTNLESVAFAIASELSLQHQGWHECACALLRYLSRLLLRRMHEGNGVAVECDSPDVAICTQRCGASCREGAAVCSDSPAVAGKPHTGAIVQAALDYCRDNAQRRLTVQEVAAAVGYSGSHLSHLFSNSVGQPLAAYLRQLRLAHACELLKATDLPVAQISREIGYADPAHFTCAFVRAYQVSPTAYRRGRPF